MRLPKKNDENRNEMDRNNNKKAFLWIRNKATGRTENP